MEEEVVVRRRGNKGAKKPPAKKRKTYLPTIVKAAFTKVTRGMYVLFWWQSRVFNPHLALPSCGEIRRFFFALCSDLLPLLCGKRCLEAMFYVPSSSGGCLMCLFLFFFAVGKTKSDYRDNEEWVYKVDDFLEPWKTHKRTLDAMDPDSARTNKSANSAEASLKDYYTSKVNIVRNGSDPVKKARVEELLTHELSFLGLVPPLAVNDGLVQDEQVVGGARSQDDDEAQAARPGKDREEGVDDLLLALSPSYDNAEGDNRAIAPVAKELVGVVDAAILTVIARLEKLNAASVRREAILVKLVQSIRQQRSHIESVAKKGGGGGQNSRKEQKKFQQSADLFRLAAHHGFWVVDWPEEEKNALLLACKYAGRTDSETLDSLDSVMERIRRDLADKIRNFIVTRLAFAYQDEHVERVMFPGYHKVICVCVFFLKKKQVVMSCCFYRMIVRSIFVRRLLHHY
jgi:hypothetical protein